jgi:hypothetical protein
MTGYKSIALAAVLMGCFAASSNASLIGFEGSGAPFGGGVAITTTTNYTESLYTFAPSADSGTSIINNHVATTTFPGDSTAWVLFSGTTTLTMSYCAGTPPCNDPFSLYNLDVGPLNINGTVSAVDFTVTGNFSSGPQQTLTFSGLSLYTTEDINWTGLTSVVFSADAAAGLDNVCTDAGCQLASTATPEPSTFLLPVAGFVITALRRRRKA